MKCLWEILVPTMFEDNKNPVRLRHHKKWDDYVRAISNGLTIMKPAKGQWIYNGDIYEDRVIPVRITCTEKQIIQIMKFTKKHYRQIDVMAYVVSEKVLFLSDKKK